MDTKRRTKPKLRERFPIFLSFLLVETFFAGSFGGGTNYHFFFPFSRGGGGSQGRSKSGTTTPGERRSNLLLFVYLIREKKSKFAGAGFTE